MKNTKMVRKLLLEAIKITDVDERRELESVFDYLIDDERGIPEAKIGLLMFGLVQGKQLADSAVQGLDAMDRLSPEAVANVVEAIAYCFPDKLYCVPEIALLNFRVWNSAPTVYKEDRGVHAMIMVALFELADDLSFDRAAMSDFDKSLSYLLMEGLQKRCFKNSIILSHQASLLSSEMKSYVERAYRGDGFRWKALHNIIAESKILFCGDDKDKSDDATLEYAIISEICFKVFNELMLETKVSMLEKHFASAR